MDIFPNEYQNLDLKRNEKMFIRYAETCTDNGYLFLNTNPAMQDGEVNHILVNKNGVLILKFFEKIDTNYFNSVISVFYNNIYLPAYETIKNRLLSNKALIGFDGKLKFNLNYCYVFSDVSKKDIVTANLSNDVDFFINESCIFRDDFSKFKINFVETTNVFLKNKEKYRSNSVLLIDDSCINAVIQRIAPEYTIIRNAIIKDKETFRGVDNELLIVEKDDSICKAFRLDNSQINIVNKISKGEQLILACAGSGKSVLLIAKCFKAAQMNPKKSF